MYVVTMELSPMISTIHRLPRGCQLGFTGGVIKVIYSQAFMIPLANDLTFLFNLINLSFSYNEYYMIGMSS